MRLRSGESSFAFADGMYDYARDTLPGVEEGELDELDQDAAGVSSGPRVPRRQDWAQVAEQLDQIDLARPGWAGASFTRMWSTCAQRWLCRRASSRPLKPALEQLARDDHPLLAYGLFNLGVALRAADQLDEARRVAEQAGRTRGRKRRSPRPGGARQARARLHCPPAAADGRCGKRARRAAGRQPLSRHRHGRLRQPGHGNGELRAGGENLADPAEPVLLDVQHSPGPAWLPGQSRAARLSGDGAGAVSGSGAQLRKPSGRADQPQSAGGRSRLGPRAAAGVFFSRARPGTDGGHHGPLAGTAGSYRLAGMAGNRSHPRGAAGVARAARHERLAGTAAGTAGGVRRGGAGNNGAGRPPPARCFTIRTC